MKRLSGNIVVKIALIVFAAFCIFTVVRLQFKNNDIRNQIAVTQEKLDRAREDLEKTRHELEMPIDEDYIINYARERLGLRMPDEVIFYN